MCEMVCQIFQKKQEEKRIEEEQAASARYSKIPACCDDDDDYDYAITLEETENSLSMRDEHLDTILATESDENVHLLIANIEALKDHPTQSSELLTKSSSTSPKSFLEDTNTFHNSLPEFENFYFDLGEISSGNEPASLLRYDSQGEAFLTVSGLGSMQQQLQELTDLCTLLQRKETGMASKINAQDLEISGLKARIKFLEDKDKGSVELSGDDAPIKGRSIEIREEAGVEKSTERGSNDTEELGRSIEIREEAGVEKSTKRGSNDTEELVNVLTSMDATNILTSGV
nr:hypothetical protein [Tanacetum cinerariifolium]